MKTILFLFLSLFYSSTQLGTTPPVDDPALKPDHVDQVYYYRLVIQLENQGYYSSNIPIDLSLKFVFGKNWQSLSVYEIQDEYLFPHMHREVPVRLTHYEVTSPSSFQFMYDSSLPGMSIGTTIITVNHQNRRFTSGYYENEDTVPPLGTTVQKGPITFLKMQ